ncbi:ABC transporter permease subunit [Proteinivorax hydrogeniformans]|uniref:ABC transporter permease subunit n=1 Tax=Proteinivorax hydrogeniformans TaxID=1826727 RepID=A0AAU8HQU0_9FIRM
MKSYITFELKRKLKDPKTWFLMAIIFIISFQMIGEYRADDARRPYRYVCHRIFPELILDAYSQFGWDVPDAAIDSLHIWMETSDQAQAAYLAEDYNEYTRLHSFVYLLNPRYTPPQADDPRAEWWDEEIKKVWDDVSGGIAYEEIEFYNPRTNSPIYYFLKNGQLYHHLHINDIEPIGRYHMDSMTFLYHYFREIVPMLLAFIILILVFDSINDQWKSGNLKLILTQPFSRKKYLLSKVTISILHVLFVILIPALVISLLLGLSDGFENFKYPVTYLEGGFTSADPMPNYLERDTERMGNYQALGISGYSLIRGDISDKLTLMPLYQFLLLALALLVLCTVFYVVLNIFISSVTKNKIIGFSAAAVISIIGIAVSQRWIVDEKLNLSPFTMNNPVNILNGNYNTTPLLAIIVLVTATALLILGNIWYFKKKDL